MIKTRRTMKTKYAILALVSIASSNIMLIARELRTPLTSQSTFGRTYIHYPVPRPKEDDTCWNFDVIGGAFTRSTDVAFTNKHGTKKEPLSGIWFGQVDFVGGQAFPPSSFDVTPDDPQGTVVVQNPFLSFGTISPRFDYNEKGAWFHFTADRAFCGGRWHVGTRINLPFRYIKTQLDCCDNFEETLEDVRRLSLEQIFNEDGNRVAIVNEQPFAYRLDFLAALMTTLNGPFEPLVMFGDGTTPTRISGHIVDNVALPTPNPVHLSFTPDGSAPTIPFSLRFSGAGQPISVENLTNLNSTGDGVFTQIIDPFDQSPSLRAKFDANTDYTPLSTNRVNQSRLWLVPTAVGFGDTVSLTNVATQIETTVERLINAINTSQIDFFANNGVTFDGQRTVGAGDLDWDVYVQRQWCDACWGYFYLEALAGVRFPTGKKIKDPGRLLAVPTGNNGHFELRGGLQGGWEPREWINIKIDGVYAWALKHTEKVAAAFRGATIKNIGPTVDADVSWGYFIGNADFTFIAPCSCLAGIDIGYNVYVKQEDNVRFKQKTAVDFFGVTQPLDSEILERRTKVIAHKIRTEAFHQGDYWELFGGWSTVVAGKNATRDTDWYIGFTVFF